jgi:hypothetical protein
LYQEVGEGGVERANATVEVHALKGRDNEEDAEGRVERDVFGRCEPVKSEQYVGG